MKKYSLYIITIPLALAIAILFLWLFKKETIVEGEQKQWIDEYLKKASQEQENKNNSNKTAISNDFKCPEDYESQQDYASALVKDAKNYQDEHPNVADDEFLRERYAQLVKYDCQKTLENIYSQEPENRAYPIKEMVQASLNLKSHPRGLEFKTVISDAYKKGPNFAGHYTVVEWGCGTTCQSHIIVDNLTGNIINAEIGSAYGVEYRLDSELFVVNPENVLVDAFGDDIPSYFKTDFYILSSDGLKMEKL